MKKLLTLLLLAALAMSVNAQTLQRTILGCTLGVTTYSQAQSTLRSKGYAIDTRNTEHGPGIIIENVFFAGSSWNLVALMFRDGKLYTVVFESQEYDTLDYEAADKFYQNYLSKLTTKYGEPLSVDNAGAQGLAWKDDQTAIALTNLTDKYNTQIIVLGYTDISLLQDKLSSELDEL